MQTGMQIIKRAAAGRSFYVFARRAFRPAANASCHSTGSSPCMSLVSYKNVLPRNAACYRRGFQHADIRSRGGFNRRMSAHPILLGSATPQGRAMSTGFPPMMHGNQARGPTQPMARSNLDINHNAEALWSAARHGQLCRANAQGRYVRPHGR